MTGSSNRFRDGPWAPFVLDAGKPDAVVDTGDGFLVRQEQIGPDAVRIPLDRVFDLVTPTMRDLDVKVTPGTPLRDRLESERTRWLAARSRSMPYGVYVYFPERGHLVQYPPAELWDAVQTISSATLYRDFGLDGTFEEMRSKVRREVPAVAGCSVGRRIAEGLMCYRFRHVKLADKKPGHPSGNNRAPHSYEEMTRHDTKASSLARRFYAEDGLAQLSVYSEGVHPGNVDEFVRGSPTTGEPAATVVFDETDDLVTKLDLRVACKTAQVAYAMITDLGHLSLVDFYDWGERADIPLIHGAEDPYTWELRAALRDDPDNMFQRRRGTMALIGGAAMLRGELKNILQGDNQRGADSPPLTDPPQDGSTCMFGGVVASRLVLAKVAGIAKSGRRLIDPLRGEVLSQTW